MILRVILYVLLIAAVLFIGFCAIIIVSFAGTGKFYVPVIIISGISLLVLTLLHLFHFVKSKNIKIAWLSFLSLFVVSCAIHEGLNAYDRSIPRVHEGNVDLHLYAPHTKNTQAVILDGPPTLKLETDLPLLDGATALYPLYSAFAQAVYPKKKYDLYGSEVACNNTVQSYQLLIDREVDIIFVAPPSKEQMGMAEKAGVTFRYTSKCIAHVGVDYFGTGPIFSGENRILLRFIAKKLKVIGYLFSSFIIQTLQAQWPEFPKECSKFRNPCFSYILTAFANCGKLSRYKYR